MSRMMNLLPWGRQQNPQPVTNPANAVAKPAQAAQAKVANQAAQAALGQVNQEPSKISRAWTAVKNNLPMVASYVAIAAAAIFVALGFGISTGALSPFAIAGYAIAGVTVLGLAAYATYKTVKERRNLDVHAKELYNAVKAFDNLNPNSNTYVTAQERYSKAQNQIKKDLIRMNPADRNAFIERIASAANNDPHLRIINLDGRYGIDLGNDPKGVTYKKFIETLVNTHSKDVQADYAKQIDSYSKTFTDVLKNDDVNLCKELRHEINKAAFEMAGKKEYRMLGKTRDDVVQDLHSAIIKKMGGAKNISKNISKLEKLMADRYDFWSNVGKVRKNIRKDYDKRYNDINKEIKGLQKDIKNYNDTLEGLKQRKETHYDYAKALNNSREKLEESRLEAEKIDAKIAEIEAGIAEKNQTITQLKNEQAILEGRVGYDHIMNLNAKRRELGKLLNKELEDLELPGHPTFGDKTKYWTPRAAIAGIAGAGLVYYGYPYAAPYVAPYVQAAGTAAAGALASVKGWFGKPTEAEAVCYPAEKPDAGGVYFPGQSSMAASLARKNVKYNDFDSFPLRNEYREYLGLQG